MTKLYALMPLSNYTSVKMSNYKDNILYFLIIIKTLFPFFVDEIKQSLFWKQTAATVLAQTKKINDVAL